MLSLRASRKLKWVVRLHFWVMFFSFVLYLGLGFSLGPEFLYQDIRKRLFAFADDTIVITATVPGPPATPIVTATPSCIAGVGRITLDWANDIGTTTWDIERDSLPLTTGLVVSQYADLAVVANTSYSYVVTAHGPMAPGIATSAPVSATALDCAIITPVTVRIETLGGKNVADARDNTDLSKRRPKVTGTSNTPYAIIDIEITNPTLRARISANANGYFEWIPPIAIDTGNHILSVTATDSVDSSRTGTDSFIFWTKNVSGSRETESLVVPRESAAAGFDFEVIINNPSHEMFQEEMLSADVVTKGGAFPSGATADIFLNDPSRQDVFRLSDRLEIGGQSSATVEEVIPLYLEPGAYRVRADVTIGKEIVSREDAFLLKGLPFLSIAGHEITYAEAASYVGFFFFMLLFLFLFLLLMFVREYWLYLHSLRAITEYHLARIGFLGHRRKGVIR